MAHNFSVLECVANVSEGRDPALIRALASACGPTLLDIHTDSDHHRSVFTMAGAPADVVAAALALARAAVALVDLRVHDGVHPRLGVLDVVPFVPLAGTPVTVAVDAALTFGRRLGAELGVPAFFYDEADPLSRSLPSVRREAFGARFPDFGPPLPHPTAGAAAVGARRLLVAVNCNLDTDDLALARGVARSVRERDGGLPGVRALGFSLTSGGRAQVSMNLVDLESTGVEAACTEVRRLVRGEGADVVDVELVGLWPVDEFNRCTQGFLTWSGLRGEDTIEARMS